MKKYSFCFFAALIVLVSSVVAPEVIYSNATKVDLCYPKLTNVNKTVTVTGKIACENEIKQLSDNVYVIEKILVYSGEKVEKGQNVIKIDVGKTNLLYQSQDVSYNGKEYIASSYSGIVNTVCVAAGDTAREETELFTLVSSERLCAVLNVGEDCFSSIKIGQAVRITGNGFKGITYSGKISKIGAVASTDVSSLTTVPVTVTLDKPDDKLKAGFTIKAKIIVKKLKNVLVLPSAAISQDDSGEYIYTISGNSPNKKYIKTGVITAKGTVVKSGVDENTPVILSPEQIKSENESVVINK